MASVLVVDDDEDLVDVLAELIRFEGHRVCTARNGLEGLKRLTAGYRPDAIVLDIDMPMLTGPEMAMRMFLEDLGMEKIPIVLLSGTADLQASAATVRTPYFLAKPCSPEELIATLQRALTEGRAPHPS
jgi:CheY-like chemotaxis protein